MPKEIVFWQRVKTSCNECWLWTGAKNIKTKKYGRFAHGGQKVQSHRFAYEFCYGQIPDGLQVCHKCDNGRCVRPDHLFLGTNAENMADKLVKGLQLKGEKVNTAKLSAAQVMEIRSRKGERPRDLAKEYGVKECTISNILANRIWKHLNIETAKKLP